MKICVVGSGYVGLVVGICLANYGNDVVCVDKDENKISLLKSGKLPIYEPGLDDLLELNQKEGRITFTTDLPEAVRNSEIIFLAVGTPPGKNHEADLSAVRAVAEVIGKNMNGYKVVVNKSTVPVGTADEVKKIISSHYDGEFDVVSNPEFLREGSAVRDFTVPDRIVVGVESERARKIMHSLYKSIERTGRPVFFCDVRSAEIIKYASNAFLATKISFINEIALLCDATGADVKKVAKGMGLDTRIGPRFLNAGIGYGGSCFPKDVQALIVTGKQHGVDFKIIKATEEVNARQKEIAFRKIKESLGDLSGKKVALWGLSFKPKTDDMRDAPSIVIANKLLEEGASVSAFDPVAINEARKVLGDRITYASSAYEAAVDADALVLVTEWDEFRNLDFKRVVESMRNPLLIDGRNIYDPQEMRAFGFNYIGIGHN
ncbi:UDP-glucose/GDP-mannose dehydrogenase family protein [Candidatus Woesearchaeota archaeon]|nr:MAG: UDP-glucose/GDP-mannose dehydrogenase family protein [Candidatus Woesearchaeota archaeon]